MTHKAQCQCGQLTVESPAEPDFVLICNCVECQRRGGSAFAIGAFFRRDSVTVSGEVKTWTRIAVSGKPLTNHFCPECGTNVYWAPEIRPDHYGVAGGCLLTEVPEPSLAIWTDEKVPWLAIPEGWAQHGKAPPRK